MLSQFIKNFIVVHYNGTTPGPYLAFMLGIEYGILRMRVKRLRAQGVVIREWQELEVGAVRPHKHGGKTYDHVKQADGTWRHVPVDPKPAIPRPKIKATSKPKRLRKKKPKPAPKHPKGRISTKPGKRAGKEPAYHNHINPDKVRIRSMQQGGQWIWDAQRRVHVYRKNASA